MREDINAVEVSMRHFETALKKVKPSVTPQMVEYYKRWLETVKQRQEEAKREAPTITL